MLILQSKNFLEVFFFDIFLIINPFFTLTLLTLAKNIKKLIKKKIKLMIKKKSINSFFCWLCKYYLFYCFINCIILWLPIKSGSCLDWTRGCHFIFKKILIRLTLKVSLKAFGLLELKFNAWRSLWRYAYGKYDNYENF